MKIRNGFVSNSSSSSFLVIIKPAKRCEYCGLKAPDLLSKMAYATTTYSDDTRTIAIGKKDILHYLKPYHDNELVELVKAAVLQPDEELAYVAISYHDQELNELVNNSKEIQILHRAG
jgi:hypothetical protein